MIIVLLFLSILIHQAGGFSSPTSPIGTNQLKVPQTRLQMHPTWTSNEVITIPLPRIMRTIGSMQIFAGSTLTYGSVSLILNNLMSNMHPGDFMFLIIFNLVYKKSLRFGHRVQGWVFKIFNMGTLFEYPKSILGFIEKRSGLFVQLLVFNYLAKLSCSFLVRLGLRIRPEFPMILSRLSYLFYGANFLDHFKAKFVHLFFPSMTEDRRKNYVFNRSVSAILWFVTFLLACEMISTYLKVPLSSTLAFGGVGGVAIGLSAKDIAANYLGGMLLLFNEPFTPGDMVSFR